MAKSVLRDDGRSNTINNVPKSHVLQLKNPWQAQKRCMPKLSRPSTLRALISLHTLMLSPREVLDCATRWVGLPQGGNELEHSVG